jgi:NitT/TauT family transport system substrate-binding protein
MTPWSRSQFIAGSLSAALATVEPVHAQPALQTLRIGVTATDVFAEAYYAADMGFFRKAGINADVQTFSSGAAASNAVIGGSLDMGVTTPLLLANGYLRGLPFVIVAAGSVNTPKAPQFLLCVKKNGPIRSAKDLVGKTVGLNVLKTVLELSLDAYLTKNNVNIADVKRVEVVFSEMAPAIERGTIDAALISEPALSVALKKGEISVLADPNADIAPRFLAGAWFTTRQFAQQNPDLVKRFASAIYETARWANTHHDQSAQILAKYTKLDPDIARTMIRAEYAERMVLPEMQTLLDVSVKYGFLPKPVTAADLVVRT